MNNKNEDVDSEKYATKENAQKCLDNAVRLYHDSLRTSIPTRAALLELSIEELAKGLLIVFKTPEYKKQSAEIFESNEKLLSTLNDDLNEYKISDFKTHYHKEKLKTIQFILTKTEEFYSNNKSILLSLFDFDDIINNYKQYLPGLNDEPYKKMEKDLSSLTAIDIAKMDKIKENGFYVDFKNGRAVEPKDVAFDLNQVRSVFIIAYVTLNILVYMLNGFKLLHDNYPKKLLGIFYDLLPEDKKKSIEGRNKWPI